MARAAVARADGDFPAARQALEAALVAEAERIRAARLRVSLAELALDERRTLDAITLALAAEPTFLREARVPSSRGSAHRGAGTGSRAASGRQQRRRSR